MCERPYLSSYGSIDYVQVYHSVLVGFLVVCLLDYSIESILLSGLSFLMSVYLFHFYLIDST